MLHALLFLLVVVPPLAFAWCGEGGAVVLALYRAPKLAAYDVLAWVFLAGAALRLGRAPHLSELGPLLSRPPLLLFAAFLGWASLTGLWGVVVENYLFELRQLSTGFLVTLTLLAWSRRDRWVAPTVQWGLVASLAIVAFVGFLQMVHPIAHLPPVRPSMGVEFPSVMGYKNPAALAVLGQLFLLAGKVLESRGSRLRQLALGALLVLEIIYLARLQSRTSYLALAAGGLCWLALLSKTRQGRRRALRIAAISACTVLLVLAADSGARTRLASALAFASAPSRYLESDRGTYLLNSIHMASCRPFGVGLGDWQTAYPVFREHDRYRSFDESFQVRRAHSDYAQLLGETGWIGLTLWCLFLLATIRAAMRKNDEFAPAASQLVALSAAMGTDYVLDLPYQSLQLFLIVFLALRTPGFEVERPAHRGPWRLAFPSTVLLLAGFYSFYAVSSLLKSREAALMTRSYLAALDAPAEAARQARLRAALAHGDRFLSLVGHDKTRFRDYLALSHSHAMVGDLEGARDLAGTALALHPYNPQTFLLLSTLEPDPKRAAKWRESHAYLLDEATCGWNRPYPGSRPPRGAL